MLTWHDSRWNSSHISVPLFSGEKHPRSKWRYVPPHKQHLAEHALELEEDRFFPSGLFKVLAAACLIVFVILKICLLVLLVFKVLSYSLLVGRSVDFKRCNAESHTLLDVCGDMSAFQGFCRSRGSRCSSWTSGGPQINGFRSSGLLFSRVAGRRA